MAPEPLLLSDPDPERAAGPATTMWRRTPSVVWPTAELLGDDDPALQAHPELPVIFVFDEALLARLRLSRGRLSFITERLAELASRRHLEVHRDDPVRVLGSEAAAATFAPVPGWRRRARDIDVAVVHPWPWLRPPSSGTVASFSAWRRSTQRST